MREVVLVSGGLDSAVLLAQQAREAAVIPLFLDYGQRAARREWRATRALAAGLGLKPVRLNLARVGEAFRARAPRREHVPIPHRNLPALALAVSFAAQVGAGAVAIGITRDDAELYPSAAPGFLDAFRAAAAALGEIAVRAPLADRCKAELVSLGAESGVDFRRTWSCLLNGPRHCGRCPQCERRQAAFAAAGVGEPADFYRGPRDPA